MTKTLIQAIMIGLVGMFLASPLPLAVVGAMSPQKIDADGRPFTHGADVMWNGFANTIAPWVQVLGLVVVAVVIVWMALRAKAAHGYAPRQRNAAIAVAIAFAGSASAMVATTPPAIALPHRDVMDAVARGRDGVTGTRGWSTADASGNDQAAPSEGATTSWGK